MDELCIYCGKKSNSRDHIPSKNLFPFVQNLKLITVPACIECNNGYSADEVFFRDQIVALTSGKSITAEYMLDTKIKRSIRRKPALALEMFSRMSLVDHYSGGIYLGKKTAVQMTDVVWERLHRILTKILRDYFIIILNTQYLITL